MKNRISYFDVEKGILMLMVIFGHCINWNNEAIKDVDITMLEPIKSLWLSFFMPAFFVITGMCSNFDRKFKDFLLRNFKGLLIPCWIFTILNPFYLPDIQIIQSLKEILFYGGNSVFWFVPALFFSKMIYWCLRNCPPLHDHHLIVLLILLIMAVSSTLLNEVGSPNYFYILQVCNLSIYLFIGEHLKKYFKKRGLMMSILVIYVIIAFFVLKTGYNVPAVARDFRCTPVQYPLYLIMSVSGCVSMLQISMWINKNPVLESIGRGSLIVFIFQSFFLVHFMNIYKESFLAHGSFASVLLLLSTIVMDVLSCLLVNWVLNREYLKWTLGKF